MAKHGSADTWLLVDGYNMSVNKHTGVRYKITAQTEPSHGIGDSWEEVSPTGMSKAEIGVESGFFNSSTSGGYVHCLYSTTMPGTPEATTRVVCMGFEGNTSGLGFVGVQGTYAQEYEVIGQSGNLARANVTYAVTGSLDRGAIIHPLGLESGATDTEAVPVDNTTVPQRTVTIVSNTASTAVKTITTQGNHNLASSGTVLIVGTSGNTPDINGEHVVTVVSDNTFTISTTAVGTSGSGGTFTLGKTVGGAVAYLQITGLTLDGSTGVQITVRDSTDNVTFADLVAFTDTAAVGAERVTVTGAVERYVAESVAYGAGGTTPSCTYFVGVSRI